MKYIILGLCVVAVGCHEATKPNSTVPNRTDVTVHKPVHEDDQGRPNSNSPNDTSAGSPTEDARKTPLNQKEDRHDLQLTADIRKRIMDSKLSVDAQNIRIISADGKVTLRGTVKSSEEKEQIDKIAKEFAGTVFVENLLEVEPSK